MSRFVSRRQVGAYPRLPLKGSLDLTYRCNNDCRHCWLRLSPDAPDGGRELALAEIRRLVDEARAMGCREWTISGGEPMLRPDFSEIFDHVTARSARYTLVTNGTLITPAVARLLKRPGAK
ncbi:MAG: putative Radical domain protein, partial [Candidatus Aminicenantes bacterium]|nr:putative Radical domain protein [Candidatus Aminicenantes bacterium]